MTDQENNELIEQTNENEASQELLIDGQPYDYVVSETAVGAIKGVKFTVDAFYDSKMPDRGKYMTTLDIAKSRFVDIYEGDVVAFDDTLNVLVVKLVKKSEQVKGKLYLRIID